MTAGPTSSAWQQTARLLGWLGVLPFVLMLAIAWTGGPKWLVDLVVGYGVLILAFMGGTLWAGAMERSKEPQPPLLASNLIVLAALPALLLPLGSATLLLAVLFTLHWLAEKIWIEHAQAGWYRRMRTAISAVVIILLVITSVVYFSAL